MLGMLDSASHTSDKAGYASTWCGSQGAGVVRLYEFTCLYPVPVLHLPAFGSGCTLRTWSWLGIYVGIYVELPSEAPNLNTAKKQTHPGAWGSHAGAETSIVRGLQPSQPRKVWSGEDFELLLFCPFSTPVT
jgi:hypothetical protein